MKPPARTGGITTNESYSFVATLTNKALSKLWSNQTYRLSVMRRMFQQSKLAENGCIEWTGRLSTNGYATLTISGMTMRGNRISWMFANSACPLTKTDICHSCDNRKCINPEHLFAGSRTDNMQDMVSKERNLNAIKFGEESNPHVLTSVQVVEIKTLLSKGAKRPPLAKQFGVTYCTIKNIETGLYRRNG